MSSSSLTRSTDIFLSHTWRADKLGRNTHARARSFCDALRRCGWSVWFDEDDLRFGSIDAAIATGIEKTRVVFVCLTLEYIRKINRGVSSMYHRDNCAKEWTCAMVRSKAMVPIVFEPSLVSSIDWPSGVVPLHLGNSMHVRACEDTWDEYAKVASEMLEAMGIDRAPAPLTGTSRALAHKLPPIQHSHSETRLQVSRPSTRSSGRPTRRQRLHSLIGGSCLTSSICA